MSDLPPGPWEASWTEGWTEGTSRLNPCVVIYDRNGDQLAWWPCTVGMGSQEDVIMAHLIRCARALHGVPVELIESGAVRDALKMQGVLPMED